MERDTHTIDAANQSLGRMATKIAVLLRGKEKPTFVPYKDDGGVVVVKNIKLMRVTGNKIEQKNYYRHSGFPGGLRTIPMKKLMAENPQEVLRKAVYGMLPPNKLRRIQIQRLRFE
ncbi:MAG: 50S ribosomal protein L13 [Candidatus Wildermuthbacteria bacterium RIFCSPHIGHO2_01_FULL_48_25]|uniref:Large ribosomal subunit protein uL13 n=1 Tax=Candidatus Wildermuthbacteria bacterium RIFCSPLOWO2_01_FULL_48_16 TaxID=1802461 RepID=A0A1G2RKT3_9BACT|nr:MAG: 50S ribosomal protein L13 [Candidatus Wildermuthbacteria bacterium RIFCSPHIGHO2_01_FULL_48_25]OHA68851.1 MAG: 50S ribosomal protein L13 [Candidatus Wildermuthbacteria bacterium RIFCSPHIGHO2_02_FULL_49_12b]OHA73446.1 MAG: 50S ribosomal protein L13 [Candidatus Wildermuthbacteria bacterium RIFCSPLOWO2_01_FULL_48_16]